MISAFSLWSAFKNAATSHSRLIPKQHDTLPTRAPSLLTERKREEKKMTAALDLTSNTGERVGKKREKVGGGGGYISAVTAC